MKLPAFLTASILGASGAFAQQTFEACIEGTSGNHELNWPTQSNFNYQVFVSPDLQSFIDTGIVEPGDGTETTYGFMTTEPKLFYRVEEVPDPYNGGFLVLPTQDQEIDLEDGICFAFNLDVLPALPTKIRIYQRTFDSGDPFEQIGSLTDFATLKGVRTLRGSAVWIPDAEGEYEVQAAVVDATGAVIGSAIRRVDVGSNQPPVITIATGPTTPSASSQFIDFTTTVTDPDGDEIRRVEFFDNGVLVGSDREAPFGDDIRDLADEFAEELWRGTHNITAKAYDERGGVGETALPFVVQITGGDARPELEITAPANGLIVQQGNTFDIAYNLTDDDGLGAIFEVTAEDIAENTIVAFDDNAPFTALTVDTTGWTLGSHTIKVVADDDDSEFSYSQFVTVFVRGGTGITFAETLTANIVDEVTAAPQGETFTGVEPSSGEFSNGIDSGLQMDTGILLTSGSFAIWNGGDSGTGEEGRSETDDPNFNDAREAGDSLLEDRIAGLDTNDAAVLEFDVFCSNGQLEIDYQFGSEEYIEYASGGEDNCFNDAFLISVDGVVVSLTPDCSDITAVNSIHPAVEASESQCLTEDLDASNAHLYLDDDDDISPTVALGNEANQVEYDGMTVRLRAHAFVTPGELHRVRIVIADVDGVGFTDHTLDSGLFIKNSSVRTIVPTP